MAGRGTPPYPMQGGYPTQPQVGGMSGYGYPQQQPQMMPQGYPQQGYPSGAPVVPPQYSQVGSAAQPTASAPPPPAQYLQYSYQQPGYAPQPMQAVPPQNMYPGYGGHAQMMPVTAQFDSGARFDSGSQQNIPPPPPGYAPTAAQMATMQGQPVLPTQKLQKWYDE